MDSAASSAHRGDDLILEQLSALERFEDARPPAFSRLEQVLGTRLAGLLVKALGGVRRRRTAA
jgi:hypothetical protein